MRPLVLDEIVDLDAYRELRDDYRPRVLALKHNRRLPVGDRVTLIFENRETMRFQVQEMMRVEQIRAPEAIQRELDVYNELVPGDNELSATLMIEITDVAHIRPELDRLIGMDEHVRLELGPQDDSVSVQAAFDENQLEEDRISAVQYIRFTLPPKAVARLRDVSVPARVRIDHASYSCEAAIPLELRSELIRDIAGDPEPLLRAAQASSHGPAVLFDEGGVRVRRPHHPAGAGHVVVEPSPPDVGWEEIDDARFAAVVTVVRRIADELQERHGTARVMSDRHATGFRWHVFAPE